MITVSYLGTNYCGWQAQKNGVGVQSVLEQAFSKLFDKKTTLYGSGRTDAGVHARGQVAHFDADTPIPYDKIPYAVNTLLPSDIRVLDCRQVPDDFHARFSAKRKTYLYSIYCSPHGNPLIDATAEQITAKLNIVSMANAAKALEGKHDFKCFEATGSNVKDTIRTVYSAEVFEDNGQIVISITGNGFLYNMVRIIAGTLVEVGRGKLQVDDIAAIIKSGDRKRAGKTLSAKGLCLLKVEYDF
ncbi:MAG: tRNA pseudouridine(38-40) synthase TruA [Clostridia bacterium]